jgi:DNA-binding response OmpR family regulator
VPRILVVEDDPRTAESIKLYLEHDGFEARLAADDYVTKPFSPLLDTQEPS